MKNPIHIRLYSPADFDASRIDFRISCRTCKCCKEIENPVWRAWQGSKLSLDDFNNATGSNMEFDPSQYINCPDCEDGFVDAWAYMSDFNQVIDYRLQKVNGSLQISISDLEISLSSEISSQIDELHGVMGSRINEQRDNVNKLCDVISELRSEIEALHSDLTTLDKRTSEIHKDFYGFASGTHDDVTTMQMNINRLRQELEQDKVIEKVFGDKGES